MLLLKNRLRLGTLLVLLTSLPAYAAPITKIEILGLRRIEPDAILEKISLKVGQDPSGDDVRRDILSIFSLGFFEDVRIDQDDGVLKVLVKERPVAIEIRYEGASEFETKDFEEATGLKPFNVLNLSKIRAAQTAIAKKYEEKGYYLARAPYEIQPMPGKSKNEVAVVFKIEENDRVRVRKIFFLGNKVFSSADLKTKIETSEGNVFSWATNGGIYREGAMDRDLIRLAEAYGSEGYIEAKFAKPRVTLSQDRRYVDIFVDVEEGKRFYLGDVTFRGDLLFTTEDLRKSFEMNEKDVFSTSKLREEVLKLTDKYGDEGYAFANVIPKPQTREGSDIVDLTFDIEKGEKVYWGTISITGNDSTHDKVIRRELQFSEGELYSATKRKKGLERIQRLGFFGDVNFLTSSPPGTQDRLDLEIRVTERRTGTLNVSAGWSSASAWIFGAQISQNNLFGLGQQLSFQLNWNQAGSKTFRLSFTDPRIFDSEWTAGFDLYLEESRIGYYPVSTYTQKLTGGSMRLGREIFEDLSLFGTYKVERALLTDVVNPDIFSTPEDADSLISSVTTTLVYDTRNNRLDPSKGFYLSGSGEFAGLGGRTFQKYGLTAKYYRPAFLGFTYRSNVEYGFLTNAFSDETVPDTERFVLGGPFSLRGYLPGSVGVLRRVTETRDNSYQGREVAINIGGTNKLIIQQEMEIVLIPDANIRAVLFVDAGNSWSGSRPTTESALLADYGWGLRWYSPIGPLRFEWGYPLTSLDTSPDDPAFNFIIAPTF